MSIIDENIRENFKTISKFLIIKINNFIVENPLIVTSSLELTHKTISEIGGRLIEEYITKAIKEGLSEAIDFEFNYLPSRSLGDFNIREKKNNLNYYFDIKSQHLSIREKTHEYYITNGINQKKPGESHPNLISYQKAVEFYEDLKKTNDDIGMIFVKYDPEILDTKVNFKISNFDRSSFFLLRDISIDNLSYGNLGKGQIQLSRLNNIKIEERSKFDFLKVIDFLKNKPRQIRRSPKI